MDMERMTIPMAVVLSLPSVDGDYFALDRGMIKPEPGQLATVGDILPYKLKEVVQDYDWHYDWEQTYPVHLFIVGRDDMGYSSYGHAWDVMRKYEGELMMGNGHHRVAKLFDMGAQHVWFSFNEYQCGY